MPFTYDRVPTRLAERPRQDTRLPPTRCQTPPLSTCAVAQQRQNDTQTTIAERHTTERQSKSTAVTTGKTSLPAPQHAAFAASSSSRAPQVTGNITHTAPCLASPRAETKQKPVAQSNEPPRQDAEIWRQRQKSPRQKKQKKKRAKASGLWRQKHI